MNATLYICSSALNLATVHAVRDRLTACGYQVLDWTSLLPAPGPDFDRQKNEDPQGRIFMFCRDACTSADLVIYLDPAGQDAACEVAMAATVGVPVLGVAKDQDALGVMLRGCVVQWFPDEDSLLDILTTNPKIWSWDADLEDEK